ncbi:MAG: carbohydrate ABC transporter permease [Acutalibacteraceae bacterium]
MTQTKRLHAADRRTQRHRVLRRIFTNRSKKLNRSRAGNIAITLMLLVFGVFSVLPIYLTVVQSLKPLNELYVYPPRLYVVTPTIHNFRSLIQLMSTTWVPISRYLFNSVLISVAGTVGNILICSMAAYPSAKYKLPGMGIFFSLVVMAMMFNPQVADVANYITMSALGMIDTYLAAIIPACATSLGFYLMRQFMVQIPDSLIEAAKIDGASDYRVFWQIVFPNVKPAWLTLAIFSFQGLWNSTNSTYIYAEELKTFPYALNQIVSGGIARAGAGAAVGVVMLVVPVVFFIFSQNRIIETMSTSGMKE